MAESGGGSTSRLPREILIFFYIYKFIGSVIKKIVRTDEMWNRRSIIYLRIKNDNLLRKNEIQTMTSTYYMSHELDAYCIFKFWQMDLWRSTL